MKDDIFKKELFVISNENINKKLITDEWFAFCPALRKQF